MLTATFDIESTGLSAVGSGILLVVVVKPYHEPTVTFRVDEYAGSLGHETRFLKAVIDELGKYHCVVGHNIAKFDLSFLKTRSRMLKVPFLPRAPLYYDTMEGAGRARYLTSPNRKGNPTRTLAHLVDLLDIPQEKTAIYPREWWEAVWGKPEKRKAAIDEIVSHCEADVRMTEQLYDILLEDDSKAVFKRW